MGKKAQKYQRPNRRAVAPAPSSDAPRWYMYAGRMFEAPTLRSLGDGVFNVAASIYFWRQPLDPRKWWVVLSVAGEGWRDVMQAVVDDFGDLVRVRA